MIVDDVLVGAHRHHGGLDFYLVENLLLGDLHYSHGPALIRVLTIESLINGTHGAFTELLRESVILVGVVRQEVDFFDLLIEVIIGEEGVLRNFFLLLETSDDLNHHFWIFFDEVFVNVVLSKHFHHLRSQPLDAAGTIQVHLQMHVVLEVGRSYLRTSYLLIKTG